MKMVGAIHSKDPFQTSSSITSNFLNDSRKQCKDMDIMKENPDNSQMFGDGLHSKNLFYIMLM